MSQGKAHLVLEISLAPGRKPAFVIENDEGRVTPALLDSDDFELVEGRIPPSWVAELHEGGSVSLGPRAWAEFRWRGTWGFWEAYYGDVHGADAADAEKAARTLYAAEKQRMAEFCQPAASGEQPVALGLSGDEALVLFEWVGRFNEGKPKTEDQAEERVLWNVEASLEREMVAPLRRDYQETLKRARDAVRDSAD